MHSVIKDPFYLADAIKLNENCRQQITARGNMDVTGLSGKSSFVKYIYGTVMIFFGGAFVSYFYRNVL